VDILKITVHFSESEVNSPCEIGAGSHQTAQILFVISVLKHYNILMRKQKSSMRGL